MGFSHEQFKNASRKHPVSRRTRPGALEDAGFARIGVPAVDTPGIENPMSAWTHTRRIGRT